VLRIRDVYPGSRFLSISDQGLGSNNNKRGGGEIIATNLKKGKFYFCSGKENI
jgi:hypothetical protein